ncbi:MAG: hypothetical protein FWH25_00375 [Syntrophorhabdaceae bacterium]|nr:hypothetical protein [Syntrophorhabdaceae bacterium]
MPKSHLSDKERKGLFQEGGDKLVYIAESMETGRCMKPVRRNIGVRVVRVAAALAFVLLLSSVSHSPAAMKNNELSFEDRAAVEKASRTNYRKLEITSLVVIFIVGAGALYWVTRKKKP